MLLLRVLNYFSKILIPRVLSHLDGNYSRQNGWCTAAIQSLPQTIMVLVLLSGKVKQPWTTSKNVTTGKWWDMSDLSDVLKVNVYLFPPLDWKISIKTSVMLGRKCPTMVFTWHRIIADINISRTFKRRRMMNSVLLITIPTINYTSSRYWAYW